MPEEKKAEVADQKAEPRVKFKLSAVHNHQGKDCQPDEVLDLRKSQADKLKEEGKGQLVPG